MQIEKIWCLSQSLPLSICEVSKETSTFYFGLGCCNHGCCDMDETPKFHSTYQAINDPVEAGNLDREAHQVDWSVSPVAGASAGAVAASHVQNLVAQ